MLSWVRAAFEDMPLKRQSSIPAFLLQKPSRVLSPLIIASPHSGSYYPERLLRLSKLDISDFHKVEDAAVDKLFSSAPASGVPLIHAVYGRSWVDLNRDPLELDPSMFKDALPKHIQSDSLRVRTGFGVIPRLVAPDVPIYDQKLLFRVEKKRLTDVHFSYHAAVQELIRRNLGTFGKSVLIDAHSMPDLPPEQQIKGKTPDFVLGDRDSSTCAQELTQTVASFLESLGYFVTVNLPYAGAYTTETYGRPTEHSHALQIEIARSLYWDGEKNAPSARFDAVWRHLTFLVGRLIDSLPSLPL